MTLENPDVSMFITRKEPHLESWSPGVWYVPRESYVQSQEQPPAGICLASGQSLILDQVDLFLRALIVEPCGQQENCSKVLWTNLERVNRWDPDYIRNILCQYGAVERSGVCHWYGCTALSSRWTIDGMEIRADIGFRIALVVTLQRTMLVSGQWQGNWDFERRWQRV